MSTAGERAPRRPPTAGLWFDAVLAAAALAACEAEVLSAPHPPAGPDAIFTGLLVAAVTVPLALRRRWPLAVACVATVAGITLLAVMSFGNVLSPTPVLLIPLYSVAAYEPLGRAVAGGIFFALALGIGVLAADGGAGSLAFGLAAGGASWLAGRGIRARRHLVAELRRTSRLIAAERGGRQALTVLAERNQVTRELQVLVAEGIASMVVYGDTALLQLARDDPGADRTIACIEDLGRQAMQQMRSMVDVLRRDDAGPVFAPVPGIGQAYELIDLLREQGREVELRVEGEPAPLPALVDLCAYRILADLLPLPHAAQRSPGSIVIVLRFTAAGLELAVTTGGPPPSGIVLATISERVRACNGRLEATGTAAGGGHLAISLPRDLERAAT